MYRRWLRPLVLAGVPALLAAVFTTAAFTTAAFVTVATTDRPALASEVTAPPAPNPPAEGISSAEYLMHGPGHDA